MGEESILRVGTGLETARGTNKILDTHIGGKRVTAGLSDITFDIDRGWLDGGRVAVNDDAIARLKENVGGRRAGDRVIELHTEDGHCAVFSSAEKLRGIQSCVWG